MLPGLDLVDGGDGRVDPVGHGTTVAGLIAGRPTTTGASPGSRQGRRSCRCGCSTKLNKYDDPAVIAEGMRWAVDHGAKVLNCRSAGALRSDEIAEALRYAADRDVVVVACTGNIGDRSVDPPGVVSGPGAGGGRGRRAERGRHRAPDRRQARARPERVATAAAGCGPGSLTAETVLTAPADNLTGARPGGGYLQAQGTSFAAPLVAATASLIRSKYPRMRRLERDQPADPGT